MKKIKTAINGINCVLEWGALLFLAITVIACVVQVFTRYVLNNSLTGTDEVARYAFIWMSCLGAGVCTQKGAHAAVTLISEKIARKPVVKSVYNIVIHLMIIVFSCIMIYYGFALLDVVKRQYSAMLGIRMDCMYLAIPIGGIAILMNAVYIIIEDIESLKSAEKKEV